MKEQSDHRLSVCCLPQIDCLSLGYNSLEHQLEDFILEIWHILEF